MVITAVDILELLGGYSSAVQMGSEELLIPRLPLHDYRVNSMPSNPMVTPAASTAARCGESSKSMGLVLLMWR